MSIEAAIMPDLKTKFLNYISNYHKGYSNRTTFGALKDVFHMRDDRKLREIAKELVRDGHWIVTTLEGIWLAESEREVIAARRHIEKRFYALARDLKDYDNLLTKGQLKLFG